MRELQVVRASAAIAEARYEHDEETMRTTIDAFRSARTPDEVAAALRLGLDSTGVNAIIELCLKRDEFRASYSPPHGANPIISVDPPGPDADYFRIYWKGASVKFGEGLKAKPQLIARLKSFLTAVEFLDKQVLLNVFEQAEPYLKR